MAKAWLGNQGHCWIFALSIQGFRAFAVVACPADCITTVEGGGVPAAPASRAGQGLSAFCLLRAGPMLSAG
jgi:hypothetical protein